MIKQQRKTNALLRARAQTVSASLAPARTRTRLVQQQQHHALRWQPSEERDPADHRAQPGKVKYAETGFSDTVPTCLTKCGRLDSNWHWNPCSYPSSPESLPRLDYTPPLPRRKPSGAQQPQLPAAGAQRRRQHLSWPRPMPRCPARQWLAAELQPAHEPRRRQSAAVRGASGELRPRRPPRELCHFLQSAILSTF